MGERVTPNFIPGLNRLPQDTTAANRILHQALVSINLQIFYLRDHNLTQVTAFNRTAITMTTESFTLNTGAKIPAIGFGTWKAAQGDAGRAVEAALDAGYRHIVSLEF